MKTPTVQKPQRAESGHLSSCLPSGWSAGNLHPLPVLSLRGPRGSAGKPRIGENRNPPSRWRKMASEQKSAPTPSRYLRSPEKRMCLLRTPRRHPSRTTVKMASGQNYSTPASSIERLPKNALGAKMGTESSSTSVPTANTEDRSDTRPINGRPCGWSVKKPRFGET